MNDFIKMAITSLGVIIPALIGYGIKYFIDRVNAKNSAFEQKISTKLYEGIIIKFQKSLEPLLYKKIVKNENKNEKSNEVNAKDLKKILDKLNGTIEDDQELFNYLDDSFLYNLKETRVILNKDLDNNTLKTLNKNFQYFSGSYFSLFNKIRKGQFLSPRSNLYRKIFSMYQNKNEKQFQRNYDIKHTVSLVLSISLLLVFLPLLIALIGLAAKSFIELISQFYSIFSPHG